MIFVAHARRLRLVHSTPLFGGISPRRCRMRKRQKQKKKSCAMCKPHKMHRANRWKPREEAALRRYESGEEERESLESLGSRGGDFDR